MEDIRNAIKASGFNVGCISKAVDTLTKTEHKKVLQAIKDGCLCTIKLSQNRMCEIEDPCYNNELDITIKHKDYYN